MNNCKFCKGYYENLKTEKNNIFESVIIQLENNKLEILNKNVNSVYWNNLYSIEIKYCPMCGKNLEKVNGDK